MKNVVLTLGLLAMSAGTSAITYVPVTPTNESPAVDATEVTTLPLLQATTPSDTLVEAQWIVYPKSDVELLGGFKSSEATHVIDYADEAKQLLHLGFAISLNNATVDAAWVYPNGVLEFVNASDTGTVVATLDIEFDTTASVADTYNFIRVQSNPESNTAYIDWHLKDSAVSPVWDMKLQAIVQTNSIGIKFGDNAFSQAFLDEVGDDSKIGVSFAGDASTFTYTINELHTLLTGNGINNMSFVCPFEAASTTCDAVQVFTEPTLVEISTPDTQVFSSQESQYQLENVLSSLSNYEFQVRYETQSGAHTASTLWSGASTFSTSLSTDYTVILLNNTNNRLYSSEDVEFRFWIKNRGQDASSDTYAYLKLPFNVLETNGTFSSEVNGQSCAVSLDEYSHSVFVCEVGELASDELISASINATIPSTFNGELKVGMAACDAFRCEGTAYQFESLTVETSAIDAAKNVSSDGESSSGGGSLFWMLLGLPLVLRRKF